MREFPFPLNKIGKNIFYAEGVNTFSIQGGGYEGGLLIFLKLVVALGEPIGAYSFVCFYLNQGNYSSVVSLISLVRVHK